jgi:LacI family transcriptional regulator
MPPSARRPTLHDVAARAGVSIKTVSRVVNGEPYVSETTASKVNKAVKELGYQQDLIASSLKRERQSATIGLVVADIANPFYSQVTRTIESQALAAGHLLITVSSDEDPRREREVIDRLIQRRVDGLILASARRDHRFLKRETELFTSIVFLDRPPVRLAADAVLLDNYRGARLAVDHLLAAWHRRIAFLSDPPLDMYTAAERFRGYEEALRDAGVSLDRSIVASRLHAPGSAAVDVARFIGSPNPPTAFFATNNRTAVGAANALADRPDVGLVGFDDIELAEALRRPVTVVSYDLQQLARSAADLLFERLDGFDGKPRRVIIPTSLIARDT